MEPWEKEISGRGMNGHPRLMPVGSPIIAPPLA